ncbi:MAG: VWA domain-containing protein, partial [Planctomycetes bacterium]|nr:VWA domain-containing protein [Planctomycetota bacterium]
MNESWLRLLGFDPSRIPPGAGTEFIWTHAPASWGVFVGLGVLSALVYMAHRLYRREMATCPPGAKVALAAIRIAVLVLLAIVFMGPALAVSIKRTVEPYVLLLLDDSLSMGIQDRYDGEAAARIASVTGMDAGALEARAPTRADLVDALLRRDQGRFLRQLRSRGRVRVMTFSDRLRVREALGLEPQSAEVQAGAEAAAEDRGPPVPPLVAAGASTDLARAIRESLALLAGSPVAAIVLVTDGQNTSGADPLAAAEFAGAQRVPILAVGVGDPRSPQNLKVADVWAPETAFVGDPLLVQARIQAEGLGSAAAAVELVARGTGGALVGRPGEAGGDETVLNRRDVALVGDSFQADVALEHTPRAAGQFIYTVRAAAQQGELIASDNERSITVRVVSEQARVLLVAGYPSWEFQLLRTLLIRDKTVNVSCWLQSLDADMRQDGDTVIERLPEKPEDLFKYDVLMLLDPDPSEFNEAWIEAIRRFLGDHAGGLLWMAGPKHTVRFLTNYRTRDVRDFLPVRLGDFTEVDLRMLSEPQTRPWRMRITPAGADHPLLVFDKDPRANSLLWEAVPGVYWSFPAMGPKPGAAALLEHSDPRLRIKDEWRPLLAAGQYGPGRSIYVGFNSTWRWRRMGERYFDQFWIQAVRYLVEGRVMGAGKRGRITTDRDVYPVGSRVAVTAVLYDAAFEPLSCPSVQAVVRGGPGSPPVETELRTILGRPGHYEGSVVAAQLGVGEIEITLPGEAGAKPIRVSKQFTVETPRVEFADP